MNSKIVAFRSIEDYRAWTQQPAYQMNSFHPSADDYRQLTEQPQLLSAQAEQLPMGMAERFAWFRRGYKLKRHTPLNPLRGKPWPRSPAETFQEQMNPNNTSRGPTTRSGASRESSVSPVWSWSPDIPISEEPPHQHSPHDFSDFQTVSCPEFGEPPVPGFISTQNHSCSGGCRDTIIKDAGFTARTHAKVQYAINLLLGTVCESPRFASGKHVPYHEEPILLLKYPSPQSCDVLDHGAVEPSHVVSAESMRGAKEHDTLANLEESASLSYLLSGHEQSQSTDHSEGPESIDLSESWFSESPDSSARQRTPSKAGDGGLRSPQALKDIESRFRQEVRDFMVKEHVRLTMLRMEIRELYKHEMGIQALCNLMNETALEVFDGDSEACDTVWAR